MNRYSFLLTFVAFILLIDSKHQVWCQFHVFQVKVENSIKNYFTNCSQQFELDPSWPKLKRLDIAHFISNGLKQLSSSYEVNLSLYFFILNIDIPYLFVVFSSLTWHHLLMSKSSKMLFFFLLVPRCI